MKKTMFITSVIMVVVMAIALTTSSLAWFTVGAQNNVTTSALTINAKAETSSGILISTASANGAWSSSVVLNNNAAVNNLYPLLPLTEDTSADAASLRAALAGSTASPTTGISPVFLGNNVDQNGKYDGSAYEGAGKFFNQSVWITNIAQGTTALPVRVTPTCAFTDADGDYTYVSTDPVLCVAVLSYDEDGDAELVSLFNSAGQSYINVGLTTASFADGASVSTSYDDLTISGNVLGTNSDPLPVPQYISQTGTYEAFGVAKRFEIIAWYDGNTLNVQNSGYSINFALTFTASNVSSGS